MKLRLASAVLVFLGSYLPLSIILLVQDLKLEGWTERCCSGGNRSDPTCLMPFAHPAWSLGILAITLASFMLTLIMLDMIKPKRDVVLHEAKYIPGDMINYVFPYVVSFMNISYSDGLKLVGFGIFMAWLFWITYKAQRVFMNPLLIVVGWRLYEVTYSFAGETRQYTALALAQDSGVVQGSYLAIRAEDVLLIRPLK